MAFEFKLKGISFICNSYFNYIYIIMKFIEFTMISLEFISFDLKYIFYHKIYLYFNILFTMISLFLFKFHNLFKKTIHLQMIQNNYF